jgi:phosphoribosylanthranilate isomerase
MTRVKVCGLTRDEDVRLAVALGAGACGFVLTDSPRRVSAAQAGELAALAGTTLAVAVVSTESPEWIAAQLAVSNLIAVQLSAGADGPSVAAVRGAAAAHGLRPTVIAAADIAGVDDADLILYDARAPGCYGGTGRTLAWESLSREPLPSRERLVLAGGLTPDNVQLAISTLRPAFVDVSSGVEISPGIKDASLLEAFIAAVAHADQERALS